MIKRISGSQLVVKLSEGTLPTSLHTLLSHPDEIQAENKYTLRVTDPAEVESILARLREANLKIEDMQLHQADLEDVFIQIMDGEK